MAVPGGLACCVAVHLGMPGWARTGGALRMRVWVRVKRRDEEMKWIGLVRHYRVKRERTDGEQSAVRSSAVFLWIQAGKRQREKG